MSERMPVRGNDDVSELTVSFNRMLDRLEASFAEQRQFLDDAGHELRTPVTILRGHLELLDPDDPADVPRPAPCCSTSWTGWRAWSRT